jgi:hypothetical protein
MATDKFNGRSPYFIIATPEGGVIEPTVVSNAQSNITQTSAVFNGQVTDEGNPSYTVRGFYWKVGSGTPTASDNNQVVSGTDTDPYSYTNASLSPDTTYSYVAYATNTEGTAIGSVITFTTATANELAVVQTSGDSNVTQTSVTLLGNIVSVGVPNYTVKGFYWKVGTGTPTSSDNVINVSGTSSGSFSANLTGLTAQTTYSFVAFATNTVGTATGSTLSFTTSSAPTDYLPTVTTISAQNVDDDSAQFIGSVTNVGNPAYTDRGFVYIQGSGTPSLTNTIADLSVSGTGTGTFSRYATGLASGQLYSYRAYATSTLGTAYGSVVTFTTVSAPTCDGGTLYLQNHVISGVNATLGTGSVSYGTGDCGTAISTVSLNFTLNTGEWQSVNQITSLQLFEGSTNVSSQYSIGKQLNGDVMTITFGGYFPSATNDGNHTYSFHITATTVVDYITTLTLPTTSTGSSGNVKHVTSVVTADSTTSYPASRDGSHNTSTLSPKGESGEAYRYVIVYTAVSGYNFTGTGNITQPVVTSGIGASVSVTGYTSTTLTVTVTGTIQSSSVSGTISYTGGPSAAAATSVTFRYRLSGSSTWLTVPSGGIDSADGATYQVEATANGSYYLQANNTSVVSSFSPSTNSDGTTMIVTVNIQSNPTSGTSTTIFAYPQGGGSTIGAIRFNYSQ